MTVCKKLVNRVIPSLHNEEAADNSIAAASPGRSWSITFCPE